MPLNILIGAQWGDEGKAKIVDYLSKNMDMIVRYQGGANAGHTVVHNGKKYVFHLIPSGILHEDKYCLIGNGVVLDPEAFLEEVALLKESNISFENRIKISASTHLIMPYHKAMDEAREASRSNKIGTTKRGIGPCYSDKSSRWGIRVIDLYSPEFENKVKTCLQRYNFLLKEYYNREELDAATIIEQYKKYRDILKPYVTDVSYLVNNAIDEGKSVLAEGAQGLGLDIDFGTYPFVTSSSPSAGGALTGIGVSPRKVDKIYAIMKAYLTRVGEGPFPTELNDKVGELLQNQGNEFGATTGRPRRCGWFDLVFASYSTMINGYSDIVLTKLDVLDGLETIKVCTAYQVEDQILTEYPHSITTLNKVKPVYKELPGWESLKGCTSYNDLPKTAKEYVEYLEDSLKTKISIVSVGPDREETLIRS